jgi:hypothetical protein
MNPIRAWNAFWFGPVSARPLGAFRVLFGLVFLANLAFCAFDLDYWYTDNGMLQGSEAREIAGPLKFSPLLWIQDPVSVRIFFAATALIACAFTLGWHTRLFSVALYLAMLSIHNRNLITASGADVLLIITCFYLMLSPCGAAFSLDAMRAARRRGTVAEPLILPWAQRLLQIQLCIVYFNTAVWKCNGATWFNGTALHFVLNNTEVGRPWLSWLTAYPLVVNVMTQGALMVEFALAFLLWFRPTRRWVIVSGLGLHAAILAVVNIPIFGELMCTYYILFLAPDEFDSVIRALNPRNWFARSRKVASPPPVKIPGRVDPPASLPAPHRPAQVPVPQHDPLATVRHNVYMHD